MRVISFCAEGIISAAKNGFFDWLKDQDADIICIQDLKAQEYDLTNDKYFPKDYFPYFFDSPEPKTNGVAIYTRVIPKAIMTGLGFTDFDIEARYIQADFDKISIGSLMVPRAIATDPKSLERKAQFLDLYQAHLDKVRNKRRDYVICGNFNIAHQHRDVQHAAAVKDTPGFQPEERRWMDELTGYLGYIDAFRLVSSDEDEFSWWPEGDRSKDGWRTDYQVVSNGLRNTVEFGTFYKNQVFSNHAPLIMDYDIELAPP